MAERTSRLLEDDPFVGSDGEPMGETTRHVDQIVILIQSLRELLRRRGVPGEYANGNQIFYWDPADPGKRVSPDVYVLRDAPARSPRCWKLWEMPSPPVFVAEIASRGTWREDLGRKKRLYRDVFRVQEYLLFDPEEALRGHGPLVAFRLVGDTYRRLPRQRSRFESRVLQASFQVIDGVLRIVDQRGQVIPCDPSEGREAGREAGREEEARRLLGLLLEQRFGALPRSAHARLAAADRDQLQAWLLATPGASSLEALLGG